MSDRDLTHFVISVNVQWIDKYEKYKNTAETPRDNTTV